MHNTLRLADLDELTLLVRDRRSRSYVAEAVNAYRGGAYRAAIVTTWIAVVYDIIAKARELAAQSDGLALNLVKGLDAAIASRNVARLQKIENSLLDMARSDFQFLSEQEHADLTKLKEDRNLCAHPAFVADETLFQPEPERVRVHLVHAVRHLLQHQPVQGKAALERLFEDLKSPEFPVEFEMVCTFLNGRYLDRAKGVLIQNVILVLLNTLLRRKDETEPEIAPDRILAALGAVAKRHPAVHESLVAERLTGLIRALNSEELQNAFLLVGLDARYWEWLEEAERVRLITVVSSGMSNSIIRSALMHALEIVDLRPHVMNAFKALSTAEQISAIAAAPRPEFTGMAIDLYAGIGGFRNAESTASAIIVPLARYFTARDIEKLLQAVASNRQIWDALGTPAIFEQIFDLTHANRAATQPFWERLLIDLAPQLATDRHRKDWAKTPWRGLVTKMEAAGFSICNLSDTA